MTTPVLELLTSNATEEAYLFFCPGCECSHWVRMRGKEPCWTWNSDRVVPTIAPSIKVESGNADGPTCCHLFIRDGKIEFLSDCTHRLAGQTVPMEGV